MLRNVVRALVVTSSALALVAGIVVAGASLESAIGGEVRRRRSRGNSSPEPSPTARPRPGQPQAEQPRAAQARTDYFRVSRTKSEVGYIYWILEGFGRHKCFILFDTWKEAVDEAARRQAAVAQNPASGVEELTFSR